MEWHPRTSRRPLLVILLLATAGSSGLAADPLEKARVLLQAGDAATAVTVLESALPALKGDRRAACIHQLRKAYETAIRKAEDTGKKAEAERYRDNLQIMDRSTRVPKPTEPIVAVEPTVSKPIESVTELPDPPAPRSTPPRDPSGDPPSGSDTFSALPTKPAPIQLASHFDDQPPARDASAVEKLGQVEPPAAAVAEPEAKDDLASADLAFEERRFEDAGRIYGLLARSRTLPETRRDAWAYCRCHEVVRRINAGPNSPNDWKEIRAEIEQIRRLSPHLWYAEYLRNLAAERSGSNAGKSPNRRAILRGASPDEPATRIGKPAASENGWKVWETTNFRVYHLDEALAEKVARVVESSRDAHVRRWTGAGPRSSWTPRCDVFLYPTSAQFRQATGQEDESPGFSTMGMNGGRVVDRRITLRADNPKLLTAVLPHEVTHVVLADLFPTAQIPRWADEGISVLSEPVSEQSLRDAELSEPLAKGKVFRVQDLMVMDYPEGDQWGVYYAQSVSLTRFLVERGSPETFVKFVQKARGSDIETELRRIYGIEGFDDLQNQWRRHAMTRLTSLASTDGNMKSR